MYECLILRRTYNTKTEVERRKSRVITVSRLNGRTRPSPLRKAGALLLCKVWKKSTPKRAKTTHQKPIVPRQIHDRLTTLSPRQRKQGTCSKLKTTIRLIASLCYDNTHVELVERLGREKERAREERTYFYGIAFPSMS